MSQVLADNPAPFAADSLTGAAHKPQPMVHRGVVIWAIAASLLLMSSSLVRSVQSKVYDESSAASLEAPFPLSQIPKQFNEWHLVEGSETVLDPMTTRITGSSDHIIGNYVDERTGVTLLVMALYGPAEPVVPHIPEVCFPASGFKEIGVAHDRDIPIADEPPVKFRTAVFSKSGGRNPLQEAVYYSFRHDGVWVPWVNTKNSPRKNPGIYKIQIQRRVVPGEAMVSDEPTEDFIKKMIPALEKMIAQALKTRASAPPSS